LAAYNANGYLPRIFERLVAQYGGNVVGAGLVVFSGLTTAAMMASVKDLSLTYSVWQILFVRSLGQMAMLTPIVVRSRGSALKSEQVKLQLVRVIFAFAAITCTFYSIANLQLAEASAITFARVIFVVALAAMFFSERAGIVGWGATIIGLAGVIVMLDPTASELNSAALVGVAGALASAGVLILIKRLTQTDETATIMCYPAIGLAILSGLPSLFTWQPITLASVPLFILSIVSGIISHWCFVNAYRHGEASVMATVDYTRLVAAAVVGFLIFSEIPKLDAVAGIVLIVGASFIALRRDEISARFRR